jgi:hypothetical protein
MNLIDLQDKLKNFSEQQLIQEMQMPTGQTPQFLLLSEITRRKKMREAFEQEQGKEQNSTVAQDVVAAAGMPMGFASQMAGNMAPQTDMAGNTGAMPQQSSMPPQRMAGGGIVALQEGGRVVVRDGRRFVEQADGRLVPEAGLRASELQVPAVRESIQEGGMSFPSYQMLSRQQRGDLGYPVSEIGGQLAFDRFSVGLGLVDPATRFSPNGLPVLPEDTGEGYIDPTQVTQGELPPVVQSLISAPSVTPNIGGYEAAYPETAAAAETPAAPQVQVPDETTIRPKARPDGLTKETTTPKPPAPPGGGGIAAVAQGAGSPSNFEQELLNMLGAREKRATQDKWLALAQAGMALMSSKDPTFGGALGEAGAVGLGALREGQSGAEADRLALLGQIEQSRMGREKLDLERQALAARSAARGGGGVKPLPAGFLTKLTDDLQAEQEALNALGPVPKPGLFFDRPDPAAPERLRRAQRIQNLQNQINFAYMPYGMMPYSSGGDDVPDLSD